MFMLNLLKEFHSENIKKLVNVSSGEQRFKKSRKIIYCKTSKRKKEVKEDAKYKVK